MEDFYSETLGIPKKEIWKTFSRAGEYEHHRLNMYPNLMLCEAKKNIINGNLDRAISILEETKPKLIDFGSNYMAFNIYNAIEYGRYFILGPDKTYKFEAEEHLKRAFYTRNYLELRKFRILEDEETAGRLEENLSSKEFLENFIDWAGIKRLHENKKSRSEKILQHQLERLREAWTPFATFPLLIPYIRLVRKKSSRACPFQKARFYTEFLKENGYEYPYDNSDILRSENHEKYFLPNFGIDELTMQEMEFYKREKNDTKKLLDASEIWQREWIKILS